MFYEVTYDMDNHDDSIKKKTNTIYAEETNLNEIVYPGVKKGFFDNVILTEMNFDYWPDVEFYYSSKVSKRESDYLLNSENWPIVHKRVKDLFEKNNIEGIEYYPIKLVDVVTDEINENYYLMYVKSFIEAYDMSRSQYKYVEKYGVYFFLPHATYMNEIECSKYDVFRCKKAVAALYVSDKIKRIVEENGLTGFNFYRTRQ